MNFLNHKHKGKWKNLLANLHCQSFFTI